VGHGTVGIGPSRRAWFEYILFLLSIFNFPFHANR
jgi:hypothetical protein